MELLSTKILIGIAIFLAAYAILQSRLKKQQLTNHKISQEYLKILHSEEYKVK